MPVMLCGQWDSLKRSEIDTFTFGRKPYILKEKLVINQSVKIYYQDSSITHFNLQQDTLFLPFFTENIASDTFFVHYKFYKDPLPDSLGRSYKSGIESKVAYITLDIPQNNKEQPLMIYHENKL